MLEIDEYQDFLAKDLTHGTLREGPHPHCLTVFVKRLSRTDKSSVPWIGHWQELSAFGCWMLDRGPAGWFVRQFPTLLGGNVPVRDVGITASEGYFATVVV